MPSYHRRQEALKTFRRGKGRFSTITLKLRFPSKLFTLWPACLAVSFVVLTRVQAQGQVTLTDNGTTVTLANGTITPVIQKNKGQISSMKLGTLETVMGNVYYSMDGGASYQQPGPCVYSVTTQTPDLVDLSFFQVCTTQPHALDIDIHYVMRSGDSGVYTYAVLSHPASHPATSVGEWRTVWKHPNDSTKFTFENIYVDDLRHWQGPSYYDILNASPTSIAEVVYLNTGVRMGAKWLVGCGKCRAS